jgi:hypothetical protein
MKKITARILSVAAILLLTLGTPSFPSDMPCCHGVPGSGPCCAHTMKCCH